MIWLWHALFDGTWVCWCPHSRWYRGQLTMAQYDAHRHRWWHP